MKNTVLTDKINTAIEQTDIDFAEFLKSLTPEEKKYVHGIISGMRIEKQMHMQQSEAAAV